MKKLIEDVNNIKQGKTMSMKEARKHYQKKKYQK